MGGRSRALSVVAAGLLWFGCVACGGGVAGPPMTWTGARALTIGEDAPTGVATDGVRVLFTTGRTQVGENALRAVAIDGEAASDVVAVTPGGRIPNGHVALDGDVAYVAAGSGIVQVRIAGGDASVVVDGRPALVDDVVVADDDLWWTTYQYGEPDRIEVARMPKAGGAIEVAAVGVAGGLGRPYPDGTGAALVASPIGVLRVLAGHPPEVVVSADAVGGAVTRLAVDDDRLYVLTAGSRHRLLAIPRRGAPVVLADDVDSTADLVVVGSDVVFFGPSHSGGRHELLAVRPAIGGPARTIASGAYPAGDLAAVGTGRVVFSAVDRVWIADVVA